MNQSSFLYPICELRANIFRKKNKRILYNMLNQYGQSLNDAIYHNIKYICWKIHDYTHCIHT